MGKLGPERWGLYVSQIRGAKSRCEGLRDLGDVLQGLLTIRSAGELFDEVWPIVVGEGIQRPEDGFSVWRDPRHDRFVADITIG
ncbi:hypothetical protein [Agrobacterium sp. NPDC090273]|uniref:hypothetical protein n=1 Tax=Agrobacterium sp. NPDC090273 TaxID=3363919 RepID=UPI003839D1B9